MSQHSRALCSDVPPLSGDWARDLSCRCSCIRYNCRSLLGSHVLRLSLGKREDEIEEEVKEVVEHTSEQTGEARGKAHIQSATRERYPHYHDFVAGLISAKALGFRREHEWDGKMTKKKIHLRALNDAIGAAEERLPLLEMKVREYETSSISS